MLQHREGSGWCLSAEVSFPAEDLSAVPSFTRPPLPSWIPVGLCLCGGVLPDRQGVRSLPPALLRRRRSQTASMCLFPTPLLVRIPSLVFGDALRPEQPWEAEHPCMSGGGGGRRGLDQGCVLSGTSCPLWWLRASSRRRARLDRAGDPGEPGQTALSKPGACADAGRFWSPRLSRHPRSHGHQPFSCFLAES